MAACSVTIVRTGSHAYAKCSCRWSSNIAPIHGRNDGMSLVRRDAAEHLKKDAVARSTKPGVAA